MHLAELERLEEEYTRRGYRVRFQRVQGNMDKGPTWVYDTLPDSSESGCATIEDAQSLLERFQKVALPEQFKDFQVIGPDLQPVESVISTEPLGALPAELEVIPLVPDTPPILQEIPALDVMLTFLVSDNVHTLCGGNDGQVYLVPAGYLAKRPNTRLKPHRTASPNVMNSLGQTIAFREYHDTETGLTAHAGFYQDTQSGAAVWFLQR